MTIGFSPKEVIDILVDYAYAKGMISSNGQRYTQIHHHGPKGMMSGITIDMEEARTKLDEQD